MTVHQDIGMDPPSGPGTRPPQGRQKLHPVLIIPGNVFSEQDTHFRISFATSDDKIRQGVEVLKGLC